MIRVGTKKTDLRASALATKDSENLHRSLNFLSHRSCFLSSLRWWLWKWLWATAITLNLRVDLEVEVFGVNTQITIASDHCCESEVQEGITDSHVCCIPPSAKLSTREEWEF